MSNKNRQEIDTIISYLLIKRLVTPIIQHPAFKLKLVNGAGRVIKEPESDKEFAALTILDRLVFKLKRLLGGRLVNLNNFLYLTTLRNEFYSKLIVNASIKQRAEILRITKDVKNLKEKYQMSEEDVVYILLSEQIEREC